MNDKQNKYRGVMVGLAVGDALGAPVEFMSRREIEHMYGVLDRMVGWADFPAGYYTDDTQMSIATAVGLIESARQFYGYHPYKAGVKEPSIYVYNEYLKWFESQDVEYNRRFPGNTCLSALALQTYGRPDAPENDSKGCGGVMRVAPCGLLPLTDDKEDKTLPPYQLGADCAALTHGNKDGWLPAGILANIIHDLVNNPGMTPRQAATAAFKEPIYYFGQNNEVLDDNCRTVRLWYIFRDSKDPEEVGEGWTGDEALIMALVAVMSTDSFSSAMESAINISGDSDSVGSIAGAIAGAYYGLSSIPLNWREKIENYSLLISLADELLYRKEEMDEREKSRSSI
jgi:ADP-ribosylglycohydrolase